ncbi:hypothetical protein HW555_008666 [Spodoptera exigua]|uniref:Uncharacterized protein n=1 Tax=Spodoptera exigua TaxID=7107 RepID=A0A835GDW7_SPOEX|nr:hypothetical protein HW555_008666 [Spodoptera exigua]
MVITPAGISGPRGLGATAERVACSPVRSPRPCTLHFTERAAFTKSTTAFFVTYCRVPSCDCSSSHRDRVTPRAGDLVETCVSTARALTYDYAVSHDDS